MSENRETQPAGSPVEVTEPSETEVLAAVERAKDPGNAGATEVALDVDPAATSSLTSPSSALGEDALVSEDPLSGTEVDGGVSGASAAVASDAGSALTRPLGSTVGLDTEPYIETPDIGMPEALPASGLEAAPLTAAASDAPVRDGEIRISADHPMAALYMQTPMPPEIRGNRGAGVLIALLGTVAFAVVYAGVIALRIAPDFPPSTFLNDGLMPFLLSWGFIAAVASFFVGVSLLVIIFGRAGWWAYVLGGFFVAALVWAATAVGYALAPEVMGLSRTSWDPATLVSDFGLTVPALGAALVAREVTVWFGAWIGARGRRVTAKNAEALAEYETALAEVRAQQP